MKRKMVSAFYIVLTVLLAGIFLTVSIAMLGNTYYKTVERAKYNAEALCREVDDVLNSYLDTCLNISTNQLITDRLYKREAYTVQDFMDDNDFLKRYFGSFREIENYIPDQFCIYTENRQVAQSAYIKHISSLEGDARQRLEAAENYEFIWEYNGGDKYLSLYRKIYAPNISLSYLEIKIPLEELTRGIKNISTDDYEEIALVSKDGEILYSDGNGSSGGRVFETVAANGYKLQLRINIHKAMFESYCMFLLFLLLFIVLVFGMRILSEIIARRITGELNEFIDLIKEDDSMMLNSALIDINGESDITEIKKKFKELIENNNKLHENIEIVNRKRQYAELNFLQYSINPHLLYNSLSCIKWCVMDKSEEEISDIIDSITEYYRIVLSGGENFITVREELQLIHRYVSIMEIIYGAKISLEFDVDEELNDIYTIKMLLQPIVENSILHGLGGVADARITIGVHGQGENIEFTVRDNGYGMDSETIKNMLSDNEGKKRKNYGIKNVLHRIKCYYGNDCDLKINSKLSEGTEVVIRIKKLIEPIYEE